MKNVIDYIDLVRVRHGDLSDREISRRLKITSPSLHHIIHNRSHPSDATMIGLASLAGIDPAEALLDLNRWRAKSDDARAIYIDLARRLGYLSAVTMLGLVLVLGTSPAQATPHATETQREQTAIQNSAAKNCAAFIRALLSTVKNALRRLMQQCRMAL